MFLRNRSEGVGRVGEGGGKVSRGRIFWMVVDNWVLFVGGFLRRCVE